MPRPARSLATALLVLVALVAGACGDDAGGGSKVAEPVTISTESLAPGAEPLPIAVIVPDYTELISTGDVPRMTPDFYADRWRAEAAVIDRDEAMGPWSARFQFIEWNPVAGTEPVCAAIAASPSMLFMSSLRLPAAIHRCLDDDGRLVLTLSSGSVAESLSVLPRAVPLAKAAVDHLAEAQLLAPPVVVVARDDGVGPRAAEAITKALEPYQIVSSTITVPTSEGVQAVRDASASLLQAIRAARPNTVLFASNTTVASELGPDLVRSPWSTIGVDVDGLTDHWASGRLPAAWRGVTAITSLAPTSTAETDFEAECRAGFEDFVAGDLPRAARAEWLVSVGRGVASTRGAIDGNQSLPPDIGYHECTLMQALSSALSSLDGPYSTEAAGRALRQGGPYLVARARQGDFGGDGTLAHHTLWVQLASPDDEVCGTAGQQCWTTPDGYRSGMVAFG